MSLFFSLLSDSVLAPTKRSRRAFKIFLFPCCYQRNWILFHTWKKREIKDWSVMTLESKCHILNLACQIRFLEMTLIMYSHFIVGFLVNFYFVTKLIFLNLSYFHELHDLNPSSYQSLFPVVVNAIYSSDK